jgi:hypothetical protein
MISYKSASMAVLTGKEIYRENTRKEVCQVMDEIDTLQCIYEENK